MDANDQAFPTWSRMYGSAPELGGDGMTLRTYIATKAMAAFIASGAMDKAHAQGVPMDMNQKAIVFNAVLIADALIAELSKP